MDSYALRTEIQGVVTEFKRKKNQHLGVCLPSYLASARAWGQGVRWEREDKISGISLENAVIVWKEKKRKSLTAWGGNYLRQRKNGGKKL